MMHVGVKLPSWGPVASPEALTAVATVAERRGFGSVWVSDHVVMPVEPVSRYPFSDDGRPPFEPRTSFYDPFVTLAWVAANTQRVQLGTGVLVLPMRSPLGVAKQVATLDVLSRGRAVVGVGTGWMREEFELLGEDFAGRGARTDIGIAEMRACWGADPVVLERHRALGPVAMNPKPARGAAVPVLVGGHSPRALARAAGLGDGWYGSNVDPRRFEALAADVRRRRAAAHPGAPLAIGVKAPLMGSADVAAAVKEYEAAGADFVVLDIDVAQVAAGAVVEELERSADELDLDDRGGATPIAATLTEVD